MGGGQREGHRDKLTLLYTLLHIGKCTEEQLVRFNDAFSLMEEFQLYVSLGELKDAQMVREEKCIEGKLLSVTDEGKKSLEMFEGDVWPSAKIQVDIHAEKWGFRIRHNYMERLGAYGCRICGDAAAAGNGKRNLQSDTDGGG